MLCVLDNKVVREHQESCSQVYEFCPQLWKLQVKKVFPHPVLLYYVLEARSGRVGHTLSPTNYLTVSLYLKGLKQFLGSSSVKTGTSAG